MKPTTLIAKRFLITGSNFAGKYTGLVAVLGIAIGCFALIVSIAVLNGFESKVTENINGIDITYSQEFDSLKTIYYDWLSYEVLNQNPDWVFIQFGTGDLFNNIISTNTLF